MQVLFDARVGTCGLDPALAIYANVADGPDPQPVGMVSDLIALRMRAIVVVDNCPPELHRRLTDVARSPESMVSVITVEYDVRDDQPEDTDVFALEPSSEALIAKLLERRFPLLSQIDAGTIAKFSGGNARIAVALAASVGRGESLAGLSDDVLFRRLFEQRNDASPALYLAAQACSIVYSFDGDNTRTDGDAELFRLGLLVGQAPDELFGHTAELRRRDLMQARGPWRALLPHAIASRLATAALQNIPPATIQTFLRDAPLRLLRSFSRRLGYLDSVEAQRIVKEWLGVDGLLADPAALNEDGRAMLQNVAPVSPQETLSALERAFGDPETSALESAKQYLDLLRSLAYDPALFVRCANLLAKISRSGDVADRSRESVNAFVSLFYLYLSGTHATIEQRLHVIEPLLRSADPRENKLGVLALSASLEVIHFISGFSFEFGTQSRDHGSWPRSRADIERWFGAALALTQTIACSDGPCSAEVRGVLADKFRWLWMTAGLHSELESVCREIAARQFWPQGWLAARRTLKLTRTEIPRRNIYCRLR